MATVGISCTGRTENRLVWRRSGPGDVEKPQAVGTLMEMLAVCAGMLCWPLHTESRPEDEAEAN